ncbi:unnamed protein product [Polarella glacialis]|uniref:Uncharacterized protein n=1 Tax=Polarella glacialis TaxID=89957 RepID=A0A813HA07_POLGL|nr:unnamed protein product [Polarella glacialis]
MPAVCGNELAAPTIVLLAHAEMEQMGSLFCFLRHDVDGELHYPVPGFSTCRLARLRMLDHIQSPRLELKGSILVATFLTTIQWPCQIKNPVILCRGVLIVGPGPCCLT